MNKNVFNEGEKEKEREKRKRLEIHTSRNFAEY